MPRFQVRGAPLGFVLLLVVLLMAHGCGHRVSSVKPSSAVALKEKPAPESRDASKEVSKEGATLREEAQKAFQTGAQFEADKKYVEAVASFKEAIKIDPTFAEAYSHLGSANIELKNYIDAIDAFKSLLEVTRAEAERLAAVHSKLGYVYGLNGNLDQAIEEYKKVIELTPNNSEAFSTLALMYGAKGLIAEAVGAYERSLELRPDNKETMRALGTLCRDNNMFVEATHIYERLYQMDNNDPQAIRSLAWLYLKLEAYPKAIDMNKRILSLEPESIGERLNLAIAYEKNAQPESAVVQYEKVLEVQPENSQLYCNLAFLYSDAKKAAQAVEVAKKGLQSKPNDGCLICAWAKALEKMADYEGAIEKLQLAVNDDQWGDYAKKQIDRQRKLIKRKEALKEKEELGY
jgi:tetratricopeptide (TPR) repeat protein